MQVTFMLTEQDLWSYHRHSNWNAFLRRPVYHVTTWAINYVIAWLGIAAFWYIFNRDFLFCLAVALVQCLLGGAGHALSTRKRFLKDIAKTPARIGERVIALDRFDMRWGRPGSGGYYYHWVSLTDLAETRTHVFLTVHGRSVLIIPKSAFPGPDEAQAFLSEVRAHWETMKHRQRYQMQESVGVWPPPPRVEA